MSIVVLDRLLREMRILMDEGEKKRLYEDIKRDFSIVGGIFRDECRELELMLTDSKMRREIEAYIEVWIRKWSNRIAEEEKEGKKMEIYA